MELADLEVFRMVVRAGGVTRAALQLHRVQSNVSTRIRKLEEELGIDLFVRTGRRMQLSASGLVLLDYADRILSLAEDARAAMHEKAPRGLLRLGAMESTAAVRLPAALAAFNEKHPNVTVELHTGHPGAMISAVLGGDLHAALVAEPVADARLATQAIYVETLVLVASANQPPIRTPRDVRNRTLLAFHPGCPHRLRLEEWFARGKVTPDRILEMASYHALLGCALVGMGIALMPMSVLDTYAERARLSVHPLRGRFGTVRTLLAWRKDQPQAAVAALRDVLVVKAGAGAPVSASHQRAVKAPSAPRRSPKAP